MDTFLPVTEALAEISNTPVEAPGDVELAPDASPELDTHEQIRRKGWIEQTAFDYEKYAQKDFTDWAGGSARYEWQGEYEEDSLGPRNEELEKQLFDDAHLPRAGHRVGELTTGLQVTCDSQTKVVPVTSWDNAGLHPVMRENVRLCLYDKPTDIQSYALPAIRQGKDMIGIAQTGSGKTGAFLIPILSDLMGKARKLAAARPNPTIDYIPEVHAVTAEPLVLIVCPTRELACQIFDEARRLCYRSMLRPCVAYGGVPVKLQREELMKGCDILIGTPGRIIDFMLQPNVLSLRRVRYTVIDEADELLQDDWEDSFTKIMSGGDMNEDDDHRYMMFSATFNKHCRKLARTHLMPDYIRVRVGNFGASQLMVKQDVRTCSLLAVFTANIYVGEKQVVFVDEALKQKALFDLILSFNPARTLVFVNSKLQCDLVDDFLFHTGMPCTSIHGDRTQREREDAIRAFRTAKSPIMLATGLSARGIDIPNVMHVINYDLPKAFHGGITEYIHRIGRTARIGNEGIATSFYNERDEELAPDLVKVLLAGKQEIPDFLEQYRPEGDKVEFNDESDESDGDSAKNGSGGTDDDAAWNVPSAEHSEIKEDETTGDAANAADDDAW
ncbi:DEAD/DEAH box RNA helicase [Penicillium verhagenii]|uniref:DEAD/DEAH box RNA helicase n=1 Tax=Penicillium verhagenii TaxID=1562060 RepID=UPI0025453EB3|nr:DEAD/DEAH box RNA helicase [Penicillium verhagenii]KAJ5930512.1 DEAD/DEAH box RNA helicase [Penicillium verhagenii]